MVWKQVNNHSLTEICLTVLGRSGFFMFQKITNTMTLVDYPLFSGVVVIHSLHVSSFREAHHQEFIFLYGQPLA